MKQKTLIISGTLLLTALLAYGAWHFSTAPSAHPTSDSVAREAEFFEKLQDSANN